MADAVWYYSQGDKQQGPVTAAQLKQLAASGQIKAVDLVWKDGMEDWAPAAQVEGLFPKPGDAPVPAPASPPSGGAPAIQTRPATPGRWSSSSANPPGGKSPLAIFEVLRYTRPVAQPLLLVGLFFVLVSKGCDSISQRSIAAAQANKSLAEFEFNDKFDRDLARLNEELAEARRNDSSKVADIQKEIDELNQDRQEQRQKLERGAWRDLEYKARTAQLNYAYWAYWREVLFVFGTLLLAFGLLACGFTGQGAEKWVCLIILAIIIYSIYLGMASGNVLGDMLLRRGN